jgi:SAM-dependent methyltransferase
MRYRVKKLEIKSENAAKSGSQVANSVVEWIKQLHIVKNTLDLGCGKLRYAKYLVKKCKHLDLVDSHVQINRRQLIENRYTTVKNYVAKRLPNADIYSIEEFLKKPRRKYDFVLCANVISAIPSKIIRGKTLRSILGCLKKTGQVLVVNQYTNSYFKKVKRSGKAIAHLDGYILCTRRGNYYYGLLPEAKMVKILLKYGFSVIKQWHSGQSAFVLAGVK